MKSHFTVGDGSTPILLMVGNGSSAPEMQDFQRAIRPDP